MGKKKETINMLADIDHFYGQSEGRLMPWLLTLGMSGFPVVIYFYYFYGFVPLWVFAIPWVFFTMRAVMIIPGREKERKKNFYKIKNDLYTSTADQSNVKTIHEDGCIEFLNGEICYCIQTYNGTIMDDIAWTQKVTGFIEKVKDFDHDIAIHNIEETSTLEERYKNIKVFKESSYAQDYIDIIDHNRKLVIVSTMLLRTTFIVRSTKLHYTELRNTVQEAISLQNAKAFKIIKVADKKEAEELCSRDIGGYINSSELLERKYFTGTYYGSKVIGVDDSNEIRQNAEDKRRLNTTDFIPR